MENPKPNLLHAPYRVNDLERTVKFYHQVFGFEEVQRYQSPCNSEHVLLQVPKSDGLIEVWHSPDGKPVPSQADLAPLAFEVPSLDDFGRHLAKLGYEYWIGPRWNQQGGGFAFVEAPDGYEIELIQRTGGGSNPILPGSRHTGQIRPPCGLGVELLQLAGRGAYGEVWLARDRQENFVAVKLLYRENFPSEDPFNRELTAIRRFQPLSRTYDSQLKILHVEQRPCQDCFYYVMEAADDLICGRQIEPGKYQARTLKSELQWKGRLALSECIQVGLALAGALENLHQKAWFTATSSRPTLCLSPDSRSWPTSVC